MFQYSLSYFIDYFVEEISPARHFSWSLISPKSDGRIGFTKVLSSYCCKLENPLGKKKQHSEVQVWSLLGMLICPFPSNSRVPQH